MIKICFICHGNICRSPMAEFVLKDMAQKKGVASEFEIISRATSTEEIGNDIHPGTRKVLKKHGIPTFPRMALQLTVRDYRQYDYLIAMDHYNLRNIRRIVGEDTQQKVSLLLSFAGRSGDIADPWYTGNFDETYRDVVEGCQGLLKTLGYLSAWGNLFHVIFS